MAKTTDNYSIRHMVTFLGTHTYCFTHFKSAGNYDANGHYNYTMTFKDKDAEGNIKDGKTVKMTTIFNGDTFYMIVDSTKGLTVDQVQKLLNFGKNLANGLVGHKQEGREFKFVFECDTIQEKAGTVSIVARKSTKIDLEGECLAERKKKELKSEKEKAADAIAKQEAKIARMRASFAENFGD